MAKTFILWIDALNSTDISAEFTPTLYKLQTSYYISELTPVFGYNSIPAAFFTGYYPESIDQFTVFARDGRESLDNLRLKFCSILPFRIEDYVENFYQYMHGDKYITHYPKYEFVKYFDLAQKKYYHQQNCLRYPTLLNIFEEKNVPFIFMKWPLFVYSVNNQNSYEVKDRLIFTKNNDMDVTNNFIYLANNSEANVYFHYIGSLDSASHFSLRGSSKHNRQLFYIDSCVKRFIDLVEITKDNLLIWSDHGMVQVKGHIDIREYLSRLNSGYHFFLDSTIARFWFENNSVKTSVMDKVSKINKGKWLSNKDRKKYHIEFGDNKFGDEIFLLNEGYVFSPNFFDKKSSYKGMHGYTGMTKEEKGIVISNRKIREDSVTVDLFNTLLDFVGIKSIKADGKSLLI